MSRIDKLFGAMTFRENLSTPKKIFFLLTLSRFDPKHVLLPQEIRGALRPFP